MAQSNRRFPQRRDEYGSRYSDLTGARFGYWTAISRSYSKWLCRCDCGEERLVFAFALVNGSSQSCGCKPRVPRLKLEETRIAATVIKGVKFYSVLPTDACSVPRALFQDLSEARAYRDGQVPPDAIDKALAEAAADASPRLRLSDPGAMDQLRESLGLPEAPAMGPSHD